MKIDLKQREGEFDPIAAIMIYVSLGIIILSLLVLIGFNVGVMLGFWR